METIKSNSGNTILLQRFASSKPKTVVEIGDRALTYNRCSSEKQDSVEWQAKVTAGVVRQNNWQLIKAFGAKESAKTDDRKEFQEMLRFCKKENISHIVFYSYDRFSRAGNLGLIDELRSKGIKVHSATQAVDDETASGRMMQKFYMVIAQMDNEQRRDKVIEGQKNKLRKGEWISVPPIGYEKRYVTGKKEHDHDKKQCFINETGRLIQQAFTWKDTEKITNTKVIARLKSMGLSLAPTDLTRIFRNPFYCGYITSTLLDEGEIIRGKHEPLVSEDLFLRVNGIDKQVTHGWNVIRENEEMPLKATARCSKCDRALTAYPQKGKYIYYKCPNLGCGVNVSNKKLHLLFHAELSKLSFNFDLIPAVKTQMENTYHSLYHRDSSRERAMREELTKLKKEFEKMEFNLAIGQVSPEIFSRHSASHSSKITAIEEELKLLVQDSSNLSNYLEIAIENLQNLPKMWENLDYTGKVRLQKLVFPDGIIYDQETHAVRTLSLNPIFSAIASISQFLVSKTELQKDLEKEKFHSLYLMFSSSNYFWDNLREIHNHTEYLKSDYPEIWKNVLYKQTNPLTVGTEVTAFKYTSNLSGDLVNHDSRIGNLALPITNYYSGTSIHLGI